MKKNYIINQTKLLMVVALFFVQFVQSQVTINSLAELKTYIVQDNINAVMTPGTYYIDSTVTGTGSLFPDPVLFEFTGSNSTYDFTGVTFEINTQVLSDFGNVDVNEMQILGNDLVLKNLTIEDIGMAAPTKRAQSIVMDGRDNRIEGFHLTIRGSYPYGYGDAFGKGGGSVIAHKKHSGILIRGLRNHLKDCNIISRSYGHIVFMQAASYPTVEGCYIEGEMRTTDDMLSETSGPAFDVGFMTVWGYTLPAGYMMSLQEAGIRAYNAGTTYIDGVEIQRATDNPTVLNCTIKNARTGVTLAHANGTKYVEGCTVLGSENGYSIGDGIVVNCGADAIYGPVYKNAYASDTGYNADITILPPSAPYYNGHKAVAYVGGKEHNLTFRSNEVSFPSDLKIMMAGDLQGLRVLNGSNASQNNHTVNDVFLKNMTNFPVVLHADATNNVVQECDTSDVINNGTGNTISSINCNSLNLALTGGAVQSTTDYGGLANRAIDGNTNGNFGSGSVTHTNPADTDAWWQVSLATEAAIGDIIIYNRTGQQSYIDRLSDFAVYVYDTNGTETFSQTFANDPPNPSKIIDAGGAMGKIIKIVQLDNTVALSIAEVEVYEYVAPTIVTLTIQENETGFCGVEGTVDSNHSGYTGTGFSNTTNNLASGIDWTIDGDAGDYTFLWRYASSSNRPADLIVNGVTVLSGITFNATGGWSSWLTQSVTVNLGAGVKNIRLEGAGNSGLGNIDYLEVTGPNAAVATCPSSAKLVSSKTLSTNTIEKLKFDVYPNPVVNEFTVSLKNSNLNLDKSIIRIYAINGQKVKEFKVLNASEIKLNVSQLNSGFYLLKISDDVNSVSKKLIKL
ncbi:T9SS type A sorting domain-containing protein [Mariniflexile sp. AS56]|uniref:T9SS type A sorting domain-containing protein n=1 Tax=Mariniflexile sp. AS56 TaxID=3063957 RepID=UPI0026EFD1A2|nr:T9SS type A sorting domain-containing protein [Mariniflexile sp. AS56]MDO7171594.1 T9SS type A sorting domain-containing protein [Mariniflexile sp. AS56]